MAEDTNEEITSEIEAPETEAPEEPEVVAHSAEESEEDLPWCVQISS